jgi:nicotinate-nucleotide pyrophosphorylase (carboxylating)
MDIQLDDMRDDITRAVKNALEEDIKSGDITAMLIPEGRVAQAEVITREDCTVCGAPWVNETFAQLDKATNINWQVHDGDRVRAGTTLFTLEGNARTLLTGERTALNFLQLLSGVASKASEFSDAIGDAKIKILDTRKTIPGLRTAQKYAVHVGGCHNHRIGLFDAFLIKENHIAACGGITAAVQAARDIAPGLPVEIETETLEELQEAIAAAADIAMLDNFSDDMLTEALGMERGETKFELSGNLSLERLKDVANLGIDFCSFGSLTKHVRAVDLSMRMNPLN